MKNNLFQQYKDYSNKRKKLKLIKISSNKIKLCKKECNFAVIVPYRNDLKDVRKKQLEKFLHFMPKYLAHLGSNHKFKIFVIEQDTKIKNNKFEERFNRGALLNIGFIQAKQQGYNYFIFHDVDLIPDKSLLKFYGAYPSDPIHIAKVNSKYSVGGKYFGGVNSFNIKDFEKINGYPNNYWGWGGEDDELYDRVADNDLDVVVPSHGFFTEMEHNRPTRNQELPFQQKMKLRLQHHNWKHNGLNSIEYDIVSENNHEKQEIIKVKLNKN